MKHDARMSETDQRRDQAEGSPGHKGLCCGWEGPTSDEKDDWDEEELAYWKRKEPGPEAAKKEGQGVKAPKRRVKPARSQEI